MRVFALEPDVAPGLARSLGAASGRLEVRRFPDGEWYVRIDDRPEGEECIVLATRPDARLLPILFASRLLREFGARRVGLVAPYLSYLRQDRRFREGESITSREFAAILGRDVDWLVTVDPHLHRHRSLEEIYPIPTGVVHAAPLLAEWIRARVERPLLVGPDVESRQWVSDVAGRIGAPALVLEKTRRGDRDVSVSVPGIERFAGHTPVLVDDIISTGRTMIATIEHLVASGSRPPVCVAVHGVLASDALPSLRAAGAATIATTNTIPNVVAEIDVTELLAKGVNDVIATSPGEHPA